MSDKTPEDWSLLAASSALEVRFYRLRNKLKAKVAGLDGKVEIALTEIALERAEAIFAEMAEDYPDWVNEQITALYALHQRCLDAPEKRRRIFEDINRIAHDLKGQGGTFGYPLVTAFASSLGRFAGLRSTISDAHVEIIKAHIDAMRAVIRERMKGQGGEVGYALARSLEQAIMKYSARPARRS